MIWDKFEFNKNRSLGYLGAWSYKLRKFIPVPFGESAVMLWDSDSEKFKELYGIGDSFVVTSDVFIYKDFDGTSFIYEEVIITTGGNPL